MTKCLKSRKMYCKSDHFLAGILFLLASFYSTYGILKECSPGTECILLKSCPQMVELVIKGNSDEVRSSICEFVGVQSKVCCPSKLSSLKIADRNETVDHESLLPTKCGLSAVADDKIINGSPAPIGAYPWMAALFYTDSFINPRKSKPRFGCGGAIINSKYVLTAAHCLDSSNLGTYKLSAIHVGDYNISSTKDCVQTRLGMTCLNSHVVAGAEETIIHPMYNKRAETSDDIALIRLNITLDFEGDSVIIKPVCLPPKGFDFKDFARTDLIAAGWGKIEFSPTSDIPLSVKVSIAEDALCKRRYKKRFLDKQLCIGGHGEGLDTCRGDSGGPLVMKRQNGSSFTQVGIVSFGTLPCGANEFPGVYTNVADYKDWIVNNLRP